MGIEIAEGDSIFEAFFNGVFCKNLSGSFEKLISKDLLNSFNMYTLLKLFYSTLISADYFATMEYHRGEAFDFKVIDEDLFNKTCEFFHLEECINKKYNFNSTITKEYDKLKNTKIEHIKINNNKSEALNKVRSWLNVQAEESLSQVLKNDQSNVYFLNIPTGGGKTNISLRLALRIIEKNKTLKNFFMYFLL